MKKIEVVAGIIMFNAEVLCVQRPHHKLLYISEKFEFKGGKIEVGENQEQALQRELTEELNLSVKNSSFFLTVNHLYPDFELKMHSFICKVDSKKITLNEHIDQKWLPINELNSLDWAAADIPIVEKLINHGPII